MALNCLKKGCTDVVRVVIVVLQGLVIILTGLKIVRDNRRAMVRKDDQEDPVQEELGLTMYAVSMAAGPASHAHPVASKRPRNQTPHAYAACCVGVPAVSQCPPPSHAGRGEEQFQTTTKGGMIGLIGSR